MSPPLRQVHAPPDLTSPAPDIVEAIAAQEGVNRADVSRILGLAMLAPDLTEGTLKGNELGGVSLRKLAKNPPARWDQQHLVVGF